MSYENAPATKMLATHCAACHRPLVDAKSVECGMGPDCRKHYGYDKPVSEEARQAANKLVYQIALDQGNSQATLQAAEELRKLGFEELAAIVIERNAAIRVEEASGELVITTPYNELATPDWRRIAGRRWDGEAKANCVPATRRAAVYALLLRHFEGALGYGPKGVFTVGQKATPKAEEAREAYKEALASHNEDERDDEEMLSC